MRYFEFLRRELDTHQRNGELGPEPDDWQRMRSLAPHEIEPWTVMVAWRTHLYRSTLKSHPTPEGCLDEDLYLEARHVMDVDEGPLSSRPGLEGLEAWRRFHPPGPPLQRCEEMHESFVLLLQELLHEVNPLRAYLFLNQCFGLTRKEYERLQEEAFKQTENGYILGDKERLRTHLTAQMLDTMDDSKRAGDRRNRINAAKVAAQLQGLTRDEKNRETLDDIIREAFGQPTQVVALGPTQILGGNVQQPALPASAGSGAGDHDGDGELITIRPGEVAEAARHRVGEGGGQDPAPGDHPAVEGVEAHRSAGDPHGTDPEAVPGHLPLPDAGSP